MGSTKTSTVGHAADSNAQDDGEHVQPLLLLKNQVGIGAGPCNLAITASGGVSKVMMEFHQPGSPAILLLVAVGFEREACWT